MQAMVDKDAIYMALDDAGLDSDALREDYSGRGMYGKECFGIVCDASGALLFAAALAANGESWEWLGDTRTDSMGLSTIWYWPGVKLVDTKED